MLKVVIVEDELHSRETLKNLINEYCETGGDPEYGSLGKRRYQRH